MIGTVRPIPGDSIMRLRSFLAFAALLMASAAVRAEPPKPAVVVQAKPVSRGGRTTCIR